MVTLANQLHMGDVRRPADLATVRDMFEQAVGAHSHAVLEVIYLQADTCRADLLVEIEARGFAPTPSAP